MAQMSCLLYRGVISLDNMKSMNNIVQFVLSITFCKFVFPFAVDMKIICCCSVIMK